MAKIDLNKGSSNEFNSSSNEFNKKVNNVKNYKYIMPGEKTNELKASRQISDEERRKLQKEMRQVVKMRKGNKSDIKIKLENMLGTIGDYIQYSIYFRKLFYFIIIIIFSIIFGKTILTIATSSWMGMAMVIGCAYLIYVKAYDNAHKIKKIIEEFIDRK